MSVVWCSHDVAGLFWSVMILQQKFKTCAVLPLPCCSTSYCTDCNQFGLLCCVKLSPPAARMKLEVTVAFVSLASACSFLVPPRVTVGLRQCQAHVTDTNGERTSSTLGSDMKHPRRLSAALTSDGTPVGDWDAKFFSPAKINLFLRVLGKRSDGFHDLASLFQTVGFGDNLFFRRLPKDALRDEFQCNMDGVPTDGSNLVLRALDLFRERSGSQDFYQVYLSKRIPPEAGLGGGSANAATALFAANELSGSTASLEDLQLWSADLGSDITFFLSTGTCYCTGRGEILHPQEPLARARIWLVKPREGLSTPVVFRHLDYDQLSRVDPAGLLHGFMKGDLVEAEYLNDLEPPAFKAMPSLHKMKLELQDLGFQHVLMSGSGSTLFCIGSPSHSGPWVEDFTKKWGAMVVDTHFINRPADAHTWYAED